MTLLCSQCLLHDGYIRKSLSTRNLKKALSAKTSYDRVHSLIIRL